MTLVLYLTTAGLPSIVVVDAGAEVMLELNVLAVVQMLVEVVPFAVTALVTEHKVVYIVTRPVRV